MPSSANERASLRRVDAFVKELEALPATQRNAAMQHLSAAMHESGGAGGAKRSGTQQACIAAATFFALCWFTLSPGSVAPIDGRAVAIQPSQPLRPSALQCDRPAQMHRGGGGGGGGVGAGAVASRGAPGGGGFGAGSTEPRPYPAHLAFEHPRDALRRIRPERNTSSFPLLLCIGQGKTATKSLNKALVMLGYNTAHFYGAGTYGLLFDNHAETKGHEFLFNVDEERHVDAVLDTPVVDFYNEILLAYPNAKVILTVRQPKSWLRSQQKHYCCYAHSCKNWLAPWRRGSNLVYGTECPSPDQAMKRYVQHNRNVFDAVPRERLLVMDIPGGDGWDKLCPFLGVKVPEGQNMSFPSRH